MKKGLRITLRILAAILLLLVLCFVAIQSPRVQTYLARKAIAALADKVDGDISVGGVSIRPFDALVLKDVVITDRSPYSYEGLPVQDTLLRVGNLSARFSLKGLLHKERVSVSRLLLEDADFNLVIEAGQDNKITTNIQRVFRLTSDPDREKKDFGDLLEASRIEAKGFHFRMLNPVSAGRHAARGLPPVPDNVIDWNNLEIKTDLLVKNLLVKDGDITGDVEKFLITEKSGWDVREVTGKVRVGHGKVLIDNLHIQDRDSDLHLRYFRMLGKLAEYSDFINSVRLEGEFVSPTVFSMQTASHFAPRLENFSFKADLTGKVDGTVNAFRIKGMSFRDQASGVSGRADGSMTGLPQIGETVMDYKVKDFRFGLNGLGDFIQEWAPGAKINLGKLGKGTGFSLDATAKGTLNKLAVQGLLSSDAGGADVDLTLRNLLDRKRGISMGGNVKTRNLDIGHIAGINALGPVTLETALEATLLPGNLQARIDSLNIKHLRALGYDYSGIAAVGTYEDNAFDGRIVCDDPNLNFLLQGRFDLSPKKRNAAYEFYANVGYADLNALNIDRRGPSKVSFQADANFIRTRDRDLLGEVNLRDVILENAAGRHKVGDITASAHSNDDIYRMRFDSQFAEGSFVGEKSPVAMVSDLKELLLRKELPALLDKPGKDWDGVPYEVHFKFNDAQQVLGFIHTGLYVEKNTELDLKVGTDGIVTGTASSGRLALGGNYLKDFRLDLDNRDGLRAGITGSAFRVGEVELLGNRIGLTADDNRFQLSYAFDNGTEAANKADILIGGRLERDADGLIVLANTQPSNLYYEGSRWDLDSDEIVLKGGDVTVDRFRITNGRQSLVVDGGVSPRKADTLSVRMNQFDISLANSFLMNGKLELKGLATGGAQLVSPSKPSFGLLAGITCDSTFLAGRPMGQLALDSHWNEDRAQFELDLKNLLNGSRNIDITGFLRPKDKVLHAEAALDRLDLGYASPFLAGIFSEFGGGLDGKVLVDGTLNKPDISSEGMKIVDGRLGIDFTQVTYKIDGPVSVDAEGLHFDDVTLSDGEDGKGSVTGGILFGGFKDFRMDTHVRFDRTRALAIAPDQGGPIYGDVYGTGRVDITGPFNALVLAVDARTAKNGDLYIPLGSGSTKATGDLLVFKQPFVEEELDPYEQMMQTHRSEKKKSKGEVEIRVRVRATPDVTAHINFGEGNGLRGQGNGLIDIRVLANQKLFTINGDYTLNQGDFRFSALNMVSREFKIRDGSSIRFNGDVMDSDLNVTAVYSTKASLGPLLSSATTETDSRREVDCIISLSDKLRNPQIKLDIDIPELEPGTQGLVESALNTEDKVMKQFLYLLIANSFLPNEESGIITTGTSNMLYSNMTGIMAGQLNSIFQKLNIPLDLGLNYQQNASGSNMFDVALSTQLFMGRVIVNGTIGNRRLYGTTTEEVTGDLDIDIKLDKPGTLRLNLFSHSADQYSSYLDNSQRNGIGFAYQREFNSLGQFFRDLFLTRREREERAAEEGFRPSERRTLQIDSLGKAHPLDENE